MPEDVLVKVHGANLLLNVNSKQAFKLASDLENFNKERKLIEENLLKEILSNIKKETNDNVIILNGEKWHEGVPRNNRCKNKR